VLRLNFRAIHDDEVVGSEDEVLLRTIEKQYFDIRFLASTSKELHSLIARLGQPVSKLALRLSCCCYNALLCQIGVLGIVEAKELASPQDG
jgi:hypothetical protein